jgi:hypothetical protein
MPKSTNVRACQRQYERRRLLDAPGAFLEIETSGHRRFRFDLLDVSPGGVCFGLEEDRPNLEPGARLHNAVLHISAHEIRGHLTVTRMTQEGFSGTVCGASFEPMTESDARRFVDVVSRLAP